MNIKRILTTTCLCIALLFTSIGFAAAIDMGYQTEEESMAHYDEVFLKNQEKACESYLKLNKSFGDVVNRKASDYPDYYGGAFINDDGNLVIYVKGDVDKYKEDFKKRAGTDEIYFKNCTYSYKELTEIMDTLNAYKLENQDDSIYANFNNYAIVDAENRIVVELDNYDDEQIKAFKKQIIDSPAIEFKKASGKIEFLTTVKPGEEIITNNSGGFVGYRAMRGSVAGFVIAGHNIALDDGVANANWDLIGYCSVSNLAVRWMLLSAGLLILL